MFQPTRDLAAMRAGMAEAWRVADRRMGELGWAPAGEAQEGRLQERYDEADDVPITLPATGRFQLVGLCTTNCEDMDFVLDNAARERVAADLEPDPRPIVQFQGRAGERFSLRITIPTCRRGRAPAGAEQPGWDCFYSTKLYRRP